MGGKDFPARANSSDRCGRAHHDPENCVAGSPTQKLRVTQATLSPRLAELRLVKTRRLKREAACRKIERGAVH